MRILVWGINYEPELTGIAPYNTGLCEYLARRGHEVRMVTTFPYYPAWEKLPGDRGRIFRTESLEGVSVHRCWHYVPRQVTTLKRILHEFSFALTSSVRVLTLPRAAVTVVVSPPLFLGPCARLVSWLRRSRYVFHVQDLQPDAAVGLGMVKPGLFVRALYGLEACAYGGARAVSGISAGMLAAFTSKKVPVGRQLYFPNWCAPLPLEPRAANEFEHCRRRADCRRQLGLPEDALIALYSGNIGRKQGLGVLVEAARLLAEAPVAPSERRVHLIIAGEGATRSELESALARQPGLPLTLLPLQPEWKYRELLGSVDLGLITQAAGTGQFFFPSKLLALLSAGLPVITVADQGSELALAVAEGKFGVNVSPEEPWQIARILRELADDPERLERLRAGTGWVRRFAAERVLAEFEARLMEIGLPRC